MFLTGFFVLLTIVCFCFARCNVLILGVKIMNYARD